MNKLKIKKGFTLVELIIVITILVILATIAFVSFNGYSKTARDSSRITTIKNISKGIDSFFIKTGNVPNVDNQSSTGYIGSDNLSYVGNIGENITNLIGMGEIPKDPLTGNNYVYGIDVNKKKYQIGGVMEEGTVSKVEGNYNGLLRTNTKVYNIPSLIFNGSGNLISDETRYVIEGGKNIAYSIDNKELTNTETGLTTLKILTNNQNVNSITGITIPSSLTGYTLSGTEYSNILGYTKDTIGISIYGNQYLTSNNSGNNNPSSLVISPFVCGDTVSAGGFTYSTKLAVDGKCWTSTNMKHGTMLVNGSLYPSDSNIIEKWCYNNDLNNCNAYGGLYTWSEAMGFSGSCNSTYCSTGENKTKSVCGALGNGWNLPTKTDFINLTNSGATGWLGNKLDGLVDYLGGYRYDNGSFYSKDSRIDHWTSKENDTDDSEIFTLYSDNINIFNYNTNKPYGLSIKCIKN